MGSLVTIVDDWVAAWRSNDGAMQRTLDLKTIDRDLITGRTGHRRSLSS
jgi:hypothetical protein